ncbi:SMP-30/gluconolactonase/LRE family protein [Paenibacillus sp. 1781tsa1]|uniref:SMP-30/gluconolactonase/LRE family protein n=1 Tax=Paenibacillus sp. 1781tsa1 TaxID=2953810 RepID=UPI00209FBF08|nr:SMP-30/gluconolactonase/LRE family protein [Paenibacillus sp. 1781tsa1]MCP1183507.1 SMP-30/gluconolactonase/LRE family protein [Paenibacillus sp. 1781tsa1]
MSDVTVAVQTPALLGEGPSWDAENNRLLWVDIESFKVHVYDPATGQDQAYDVGEHVGAVVPYRGDEVVVALRSGFHTFHLITGELHAIEDPEQDKDTNRFNDGKCDANGRFWAGTMSMNNESKAGSLYCLEEGQPVRTMVQGVSTSNGLGWSPDRKTMYYIDTPTRSIDRFDFDLTAGTIQNRTSVIHIPEELGFPDGMTVDGEGMLWVAHWGGGRITRWNPDTSELLQQIDIPADQVTSCCFGGPDLEELYITTARIGIKEERLKETPDAGSLFVIRPGVKGQETHAYGSSK